MVLIGVRGALTVKPTRHQLICIHQGLKVSKVTHQLMEFKTLKIITIKKMLTLIGMDTHLKLICKRIRQHMGSAQISLIRSLKLDLRLISNLMPNSSTSTHHLNTLMMEDISI
jgi:hypothetical protein